MGMLGSIMSASSSASALNSQAKIRRSQGDAALSRAQAQASRTREASRKNMLIAAEQMATERGNQRRAVGAARAQGSTSGFTSQGSGDAVADAVRVAYDEGIGNMAQSASIESMNAEQAAIDTVRQGELEKMAAYGEADQLRRQSKNIRRGMWWSGASAVGGLIGGIESATGAATSFGSVFGGGGSGAAAGAGSGSGSASGGAAGASSGGGFSWGDAFKSVYSGTEAGWGLASSVNPYMAKFTPQNWTDSLWASFQQKK